MVAELDITRKHSGYLGVLWMRSGDASTQVSVLVMDPERDPEELRTRP